MNEVTRPRLEGSVAVRGGRRLGFAQFGSPHGPAIIWMHGTPGARRQIPVEARAYAEREGLPIIGIDRPGIGSSPPHVYESVLDWSEDLELVADTLGIDAASGGAVALAARLAPRLAPLMAAGRVPVGVALTLAVRLLTPVAGPVLDAYARVQPAGDRQLLGRPEFRAMFADDLLNGSRKQVTAPLSDLILFARH